MPQRRPASVTIIGWLFTFFGAIQCIGGLSTACVAANPAFVELMADAQPGALWRYYPLVAGVLGGFAWYSGRSFLGLQGWARTSLETISWLGLAGSLAAGVHVVGLYFRQPEVFFAGIGAPIGPALLVVCAMAAVVLSVMIGFLRGATVRAAVRGDPPAAPSWPHAAS